MEKKDFKGEVFDFLKDLIVIAIVVLVIRTFLAEPFQISGQSMADSYYNQEFIIVDRLSYLDIPKIKEGEVKRGDVVVFKPWVSDVKEYFIKRVIWIGGDTVKIKDWEVFLKISWASDFVKLDEQYLNEENYWNTRIWNVKTENVYKVPTWKYFVMWDNRWHSSDSRVCFSHSCSSTSRDSFISKAEITGKVLLDLGYFNFKDFSFTNPWNNWYTEIKWLDTTPTWFSSPSTYDYNL